MVPLWLCTPEFTQQMGEEWKSIGPKQVDGMAPGAWDLSEHHFPQPQNAGKWHTYLTVKCV